MIDELRRMVIYSENFAYSGPFIGFWEHYLSSVKLFGAFLVGHSTVADQRYNCPRSWLASLVLA